MSENKNVPELRFPEFDGEWGIIQLGDAGKVSMCKRVMKDETSPSGDIPFFKIGTFGKEPDAFISKTTFDDYKSRFSYPKKGDILISAAGTIGRTVVFDGKPAYFQDSNIVWIDNAEELLINPFLAYSYQRIKWTTEDTTIARLYNDTLRRIRFSIPGIGEQQKIADFLSAVDKKIEQLIEKHRLLTEYKKGVMQQIFSQKIRFKDDEGNDYPEWEKKRLGDFLQERRFQAPKSEQYPLMAFVAYKGVSEKGDRYNRDFLVSDAEGKKYKQTEYGDFIYSSNNLEAGSIGVNTFGSASISPVYSIFKVEGGCDFRFIANYLVRKSFLNKMVKYRQGVVYGQWRIHESEFLKIEETIPSFEEQQKIADFLTAIDNKIDQAWSKLEQTKAFKNGLLQKMFV